MTDLEPLHIDPETFLYDHCTLPALPEVVTKLQEILRDPDIDISVVVDLVSGDPSLVAQLLKVANSAYYGLPRHVNDVRFAIAFLGQ